MRYTIRPETGGVLTIPIVDNRSIATRCLARGDRVVHPDYGPATVLRTVKSTGATWICLDDKGTEGTCNAEILTRLSPR